MSDQENVVVVKKSGFANLDPIKHREICSKGGKSAHAKNKAYKFTSETARAAGAKAGHQHSREHMAALSKLAHAKRKANKKQARPTAPEDPT